MLIQESLLLIIALLMNHLGVAANTSSAKGMENQKIKGQEVMNKVNKSESEWKKGLTPEEFAVTRQACTEIPFTGKYNNWKEKGVFKCVCCGAVLFDSDHKFDSGTGWPSFWNAAKTDNIETRIDNSLGMNRVEVLCRQCEAHLGHLFTDGPPPTKQRYCINSAALKFEEKK